MNQTRPTAAQIADAKTALEGVNVGDRLTPEQIKAQTMLSSCQAGCTCGECPK